MPPLRKGGTRREPPGGSTWLGCESVAVEQICSCCACQSDVWRSGGRDPRASHVDPSCLGRSRACPPLTQGRHRERMPPLRKGGTRREPPGGSTWLGSESVAVERICSCCARQSDVWRSGGRDARASHVDPSCLGVAETVLPLRRGGYEKPPAGRGMLSALGWGFGGWGG